MTKYNVSEKKNFGTIEVTNQEVVSVKDGKYRKINLIGKLEGEDYEIKFLSAILTPTGEKALWLPSEGQEVAGALGKLCKAVGIEEFDDEEKQFVGKKIPVKRNEEGYWRLSI